MASKYPPGSLELAGSGGGPMLPPAPEDLTPEVDKVLFGDKGAAMATDERGSAPPPLGKLLRDYDDFVVTAQPDPQGRTVCSPGYAGFAKFLDPRKLVPGAMAYVVVLRNVDLPNGGKVCMTSGNIAVQVGHVIAKLTQESNWDVAESGIALLSVADSKDLAQLAMGLDLEGTAHVKYEDEGKLYGDGIKVFTALATHPIQKNGSAVLKKLRPWKCACNADDRNERLGLRANASEVAAVRVQPGSRAAEQAGVNVQTPGTSDRGHGWRKQGGDCNG